MTPFLSHILVLRHCSGQNSSTLKTRQNRIRCCIDILYVNETVRNQKWKQISFRALFLLSKNLEEILFLLNWDWLKMIAKRRATLVTGRRNHLTRKRAERRRNDHKPETKAEKCVCSPQAILGQVAGRLWFDHEPVIEDECTGISKQISCIHIRCTKTVLYWGMFFISSLAKSTF